MMAVCKHQGYAVAIGNVSLLSPTSSLHEVTS